MKRSAANIVREYGPFPDVERRTWRHLSTAPTSGLRPATQLNAVDPDSGKTVRALDVAAHAGTAFDGRHLFQIAENRIQKIDPDSGRCSQRYRRPKAATPDWPGRKARSGSGSTATARSTRSIPQTGAILRTIESNRFVTGVTWVDDELWHGTWEADQSELRQGRSASRAKCLSRSTCRRASAYRGSSSNGGDTFFCGGGGSGKVRAVRRPR